MKKNNSNIKNEYHKPEWRVIIEMLHKVDIVLLNRIIRKMIYYLYTSNVKEITDLIHELEPDYHSSDSSDQLYSNVPYPKIKLTDMRKFTEKVFKIAEENISVEEICNQINTWLAQERSRFLSIAVENINISLADIIEALNRFMNIPEKERFVSPDDYVNLRVSLIRRFLSNDLQYINIAKHFLRVSTFHTLTENIIGPDRGSGRLGGKSAGLIVAYKIIETEKKHHPELKNVRVPKSWYLTSDTIMDFIHYNALEEITSLRYMKTEEIRTGYPYLQQLFKNSFFPPEIVNKLEFLLSHIGEKPIIVRSSSLLEDSFDATFSGKYKSLFLANTGTIKERLNALLNALAEIYASIFGPDPIEYRKERGLIDFQEEMGILIQEVVGNKIGKYFFPTFAGVAFSNNEFRWSPRIKREDGVLRIVAGLGTRAVDRVGDDYPFLASPGQPGLRVNIDHKDIIRYSQNKMDVLNLETNTFETLSVEEILTEYGNQVPGINKIISINKFGNLTPPLGVLWDSEEYDFVVTFQNLTENSNFLQKTHIILNILKKEFGTPVDVEFASDGRDLYILQCRPQGQSHFEERVEMPQNIDDDKVIFLAVKFVTTGFIPDVKYIVYVVPEAYDSLPTITDMKKVALLVSKLNKMIPKKEFILIGPGRWGSRGDIKMGVQVAYSDINNTAMLVELAYSKDGYVPDLSFGTHFFQDLVEANIKYLPIYPDEKGNSFNKEFLENSKNLLLEYLPDEEKMADVIKVVSIPETNQGSKMSVIMDGDNEKAVAFIE